MPTIEIDGKSYKAENGQMIIEVADREKVHIPRFCYHKKLSVAANCRMCLVEVENGRKPVPACATPITDGMKILTQSKEALHSQKVVMEFLLINHPLDCPICDQGGECELQDVAMDYGSDTSRFSEGKRCVKDEDIGPLIETHMTRCIHCTRCVRFGEEVAGLRELGATGRGEDTQIGTYIKHSVHSEISGNVIDLCPVGALTNKPFRYAARAWELQQTPTVAMHDCIGSNIYAHSRRQQVMRVVPRDNESINETWISDRDRYGVNGVNYEDRLAQPMIKKDCKWMAVDWETALSRVAHQLRDIINAVGAEQIAALMSPNATLEEAYLLQKLVRGLGGHNIDHRIRETDFADQENMPLHPGMAFSYQALNQQEALLLVGSNIRFEQPMAAIKLRQAVEQKADIMVINPVDFDFNFSVSSKQILAPAEMVHALAKVAKVLIDKAENPEAAAVELLKDVTVDSQAKATAKKLKKAKHASIILGACAQQSQNAAALRSLANLVAQLSGAQLVLMTDGANSAGAWLAGAVPHRGAMGNEVTTVGLDTKAAWQKKLRAYLIFGFEPELDCAHPTLAKQALANAECVVSFSPYTTAAIREYADVILPITPYTEMSGTVVNVEGQWQKLRPSVKPYAQSRPAWKILRVLANLFHLPGFDYDNIQAVRDEVQSLYNEQLFAQPQAYYPTSLADISDKSLVRIGPWAMYRSDSIVRRSAALQETAIDEKPVLRINSAMAKHLNVAAGDMLSVQQEGKAVMLAVELDERVADGCVYLLSGFVQSNKVDSAFGNIVLSNKPAKKGSKA